MLFPEFLFDSLEECGKVDGDFYDTYTAWGVCRAHGDGDCKKCDVTDLCPLLPIIMKKNKCTLSDDEFNNANEAELCPFGVFYNIIGFRYPACTHPKDINGGFFVTECGCKNTYKFHQFDKLIDKRKKKIIELINNVSGMSYHRGTFASCAHIYPSRFESMGMDLEKVKKEIHALLEIKEPEHEAS